MLRSPEALIDAPDNKGIEALVEIAPGRLLAVTEGMVASDSPGDVRLRGWLISENEAPAALSYAVTGPLRPTALAKIPGGDLLVLERSDRKSTRLNSSHKPISYAVFCLKKNNPPPAPPPPPLLLLLL